MGNCVSNKSTTGNVVTGEEYTNKKSNTTDKEDTPAIVHDPTTITVNKESSMRDDNSIFDINTSSKTLDTLGLNKITDDKASTASLKSFPISENAVKIKSKEASLNAVSENTDDNKSLTTQEKEAETEQAIEEEKPSANEEEAMSNTNQNNSNNDDETPPSPKMTTQPAIIITQEKSSGDNVEAYIKTVDMSQETKMDESFLRPSAGVTNLASTSQAKDDSKLQVDEFASVLRLACAGSNNRLLVDKCKGASELTLERSMNAYGGNGGFLFNILKAMEVLSSIELSGLYMGPVAFRAVLMSLKFSISIKSVNLSDNMGDPECCDLIKELLIENSSIESLNLSGNMLGKESLSKSIGHALLSNSTLEKLNISSCGISSFHAICEAIRMNEHSAVMDLNLCHNNLSDEQQFAIDLSLLLEQDTCRIKKLNISGMGISSANMETLLKSFSSNKSLSELLIAQNEVKSQSVLAKFIAEATSHPGFKVLDLSNSKCEESLECDYSFTWPDDKRASEVLEISIANCSLDDTSMNCLKSLAGKLTQLQRLNISGNNHLTKNGFKTLSEFFDCNTGPLHIIFDSSTNTDCFLPCLKFLPQVKKLSLKKSKLNENVVKIFDDFTQVFDEINVDGIKLGATKMLNDLLSYKCCHCLTTLSLSNCILNDSDVSPVISQLKKTSPKSTLKSLDLSINRLTDVVVKDMVEALLYADTHPLCKIDFSNNQLKDSSLHEITKLFTSTAHKTNLNSINLANNNICSGALKQFLRCLSVKNNNFPLSNFDFRSQNQGFNESETEDIAEVLMAKMFDAELDSSGFDLPDIRNRFTLHLTNLGGTAGANLRSIDSVAIKTDLIKVKKLTGCFADSMEIFGYLTSSVLSTDHQFAVTLTMEQWTKLLGQDSPKWMQVNSNLKKSVFITHMPATVTHQRLEGLLEMEADCNIKDVYLLKDPIVRKPTGSAWLLFEDEDSVSRAIDWFVNGEAQMYGTPFIISRVPVVIDDDAGAEILARKELEMKEKTLQKERKADQNLLAQSEKLAAERAAYREAHPAYQNGRIS